MLIFVSCNYDLGTRRFKNSSVDSNEQSRLQTLELPPEKDKRVIEGLMYFGAPACANFCPCVLPHQGIQIFSV